jgi:hypothetical protein
MVRLEKPDFLVIRRFPGFLYKTALFVEPKCLFAPASEREIWTQPHCTLLCTTVYLI